MTKQVLFFILYSNFFLYIFPNHFTNHTIVLLQFTTFALLLRDTWFMKDLFKTGFYIPTQQPSD